MMSGYVDDRPSPRSSSPQARRYVVERACGGWCVALNGCRTRPLARCRDAERLARRLQSQADRLNR